jgi:hypothetical protein
MVGAAIAVVILGLASDVRPTRRRLPCMTAWRSIKIALGVVTKPERIARAAFRKQNPALRVADRRRSRSVCRRRLLRGIRGRQVTASTQSLRQPPTPFRLTTIPRTARKTGCESCESSNDRTTPRPRLPCELIGGVWIEPPAAWPAPSR